MHFELDVRRLPRWLGFAFAVAAASSATAAPLYDFSWRSTATVSRVERGEIVTQRGERSGSGKLTLTAANDGFTFEFSGRGGEGRGSIAAGSVEGMTFPTPEEAGIPPAPPHPSGGWIKAEGDPASPTRFEISYAEAFVCRTVPRACDNIVTWERTFSGKATLGRTDARRRP